MSDASRIEETRAALRAEVERLTLESVGLESALNDALREIATLREVNAAQADNYANLAEQYRRAQQRVRTLENRIARDAFLEGAIPSREETPQ